MKCFACAGMGACVCIPDAAVTSGFYMSALTTRWLHFITSCSRAQHQKNWQTVCLTACLTHNKTVSIRRASAGLTHTLTHTLSMSFYLHRDFALTSIHFDSQTLTFTLNLTVISTGLTLTLTSTQLTPQS